MRKLIITTLMVLASGIASALPVGNPADTALFMNGLCWGGGTCIDPCLRWCDMFNLRLGFYGDYVYNRHLEIRHSGGTEHDIDDTEIYTNAGWIALNICNWIDLFATVGATDMMIFTDGSSLAATTNPADSTMVKIDFRTDFSWSVGAKAIAWSCKGFDFGVEGQYFRTTPSIDSMVRYASGDITYFNANNTATWQEWQVGITAAYTMRTGCPGVAFAPYMGLKWSGARLDMGDMTFLFEGTATQNYRLRDMQSKKLWGYAVGMSATVCDAVGVSVEGRFADEKAVSVVGQFRF